MLRESLRKPLRRKDCHREGTGNEHRAQVGICATGKYDDCNE
jgi:hypothetical protein